MKAVEWVSDGWGVEEKWGVFFFRAGVGGGQERRAGAKRRGFPTLFLHNT